MLVETDELGTGGRPDFDLLEPPYLASGRSRPQIVEAPSSATSGETFAVQVASDGPSPDEVVVMAFGTTLLANNVGQRLVELAVVATERAGRTLIVRAPPPSWAPAGRYLLFVLAKRVPSTAVPMELFN